MLHLSGTYSFQTACHDLSLPFQETGIPGVKFIQCGTVFPLKWEKSLTLDIIPLDELDGSFLLAILQNSKLTLIRDPFGQRTLYYRHEQESIAFSEKLADLHHPEDHTDPDALADYLSLGYICAPKTIYNEVQELPPGSALFLEPHKPPVIQRYFTPRFTDENHTLSLRDAAEQARCLLQQSVSRWLEAIPVQGALLSGGIDSGLVLATAHSQKKDVPAFTVGFADARYNEIPLATATAKHLGAQHIPQVIGPPTTEKLSPFFKNMEEPFADSSLLATAAALRLAAANDCSGVLCGDGGDELFGGYRRYQLTRLREKIPAPLQKMLGGLGRIFSPLLPKGTDRRGRISDLIRTLRAFSLPPLQAYASYQQIFSPEQLASLCPNLRPTYLAQWESHAHPSMQATANTLDLLYYLPEDGCRKLRLASRLAGVSTVCPVLSRKLAQFALSLPPENRTTLTETKRVLRILARETLPAAILKQSKKGFGVPMAGWLRTNLREPLLELEKTVSVWDTEGFFHPNALHQLVSAHLSGSENHDARLWAILCYKFWKETHSNTKRI